MKVSKEGIINISEEVGELMENIHKKPCQELKYCPYGSLVEQFPLPSIARKEAIAHNKYLKKALKEGVFDRGECLMTREMAEKEIAEFNPKDYPVESDRDEWGVCGVFGHFCPVMFVAEPFVDDEED